MRDDLIHWDAVYAARSRAQEVRLEVQHTRWQAAQTRQQAQLTRLARHMPEANPLTLALTADILTQYGLLDDPPSSGAPRVRHPGHAPRRSAPSTRSSTRSPQASKGAGVRTRAARGSSAAVAGA